MASKTSGKTKLFISYSRKDRGRIERLYDALASEEDLRVFRDTDDILPTEEWKPRLEKLIRESDTIIFALSPASAASEVCAWELELAASLNKRIIPIVVENVDGAVPEAVSKLNYIFLTEADDFGRGLTKIQDAISLDIDWVREHTRLGELADRWEKAVRLGAQPLRGKELEAAERWLVEQPKNAPQPTELQRRYILESRKAATRRARITVMGSIAAMLIVGVLGVFAWMQRGEAVAQRVLAEEQTVVAENERNRATIAQSEAEKQRDEARQQRSIAEAQTGIAKEQTLLAESALTSVLEKLADLLENAQYAYFEGDYSKNGLISVAKAAANITSELEQDFSGRANIYASRVGIFSMVSNIMFEQGEYRESVGYSLQALNTIEAGALDPLTSNARFLWEQMADSLIKIGEFREAQKYYLLLAEDAKRLMTERQQIDGVVNCDDQLRKARFELKAASAIRSAGEAAIFRNQFLSVIADIEQTKEVSDWTDKCNNEWKSTLDGVE